MIVAELPFNPFIQMLRRCGAKQGFSLMAIFIARHAECSWAFDEINRSWSSLHDVTGSHLLFLTLDAKNSSPIAGWDIGCRLNELAGSVRGNYGVVAFASQFRLMQTVDAPEIDNFVKPWSQLTSEEFVARHVRERRRLEGWADDHTLAISAAVETLDELDENNVPCIYFELLHDNSSVTIPLPRYSDGKSIYDGFKMLISGFQGRFSELQKLTNEISNLTDTLREFSGRSSALQRCLESSEWLKQWIDRSDDVAPNIRSFVESCIAGQGSTKEVYKVIAPLIPLVSKDEFRTLRTHLNRLSAMHCSNAKAQEIHQQIQSKRETQDSICQVIRHGIVDSFGIGLQTSAASAKRFDVALSFPGEHRSYVERVADELARVRGKEKIFYDNYHQAELARPNLDVLLLDVYRNSSELVVVFLCEDYQNKDWCGLESRAIRDLIKNRADDSIMLVRVGKGDVDGFLSIDGYIDGARNTPTKVAELILQRLGRT